MPVRFLCTTAVGVYVCVCVCVYVRACMHACVCVWPQAVCSAVMGTVFEAETVLTG